jgi:hypothetical protein
MGDACRRDLNRVQFERHGFSGLAFPGVTGL